jgi:hypothetical protein
VENAFEEWKMLLSSKRVSGTQVHDARLVAVMLATFRRKNEASTPMFIEAGLERNCGSI